MANIKFTDTIEVTASHGRLAKAAQIYDDQQKATQAALNQKFAAFKSGTDFTSITDTNAEDFKSGLADLAAKKVLKGQLVRNADADWQIGEGNALEYPTGTIFIALKDITNVTNITSSDFSNFLLALVPEGSFIVSNLNYIMNLLTNEVGPRLEALEAKLKV